MKKTILCTTFLFLLTNLLSAGDDIWTADLEAAKKEAAKNKKDILINFTGSDWCGWCMRLEKEIFSTKTFKEKGPKNFVLVKLDFPQKNEQSAEVKKKNQMLAQEYGVRGFPSIVLTNAAGEIYGRTGYHKGGPESYIKHLATFRTNQKKSNEFFEKAKKAEGLEKAKLLDIALEALFATRVAGDIDINKTIETIKKLDKDNKAFLKLKYELPDKFKNIWKQAEESKDVNKAITDSKELIQLTKSNPELLQQVYLFQTNLNLRLKEDKKSALECLKKAHKTAPNSRVGKTLLEDIKYLQKEIEKDTPKDTKKEDKENTDKNKKK